MSIISNMATSRSTVRLCVRYLLYTCMALFRKRALYYKDILRQRALHLVSNMAASVRYYSHSRTHTHTQHKHAGTAARDNQHLPRPGVCVCVCVCLCLWVHLVCVNTSSVKCTRLSFKRRRRFYSNAGFCDQKVLNSSTECQKTLKIPWWRCHSPQISN